MAISYSTLLKISVSLILLVSFVNAYKIGSDVSKIDIKSNLEELVCKNISIFSDFEGILFVEDYWSKSFSKDVNDFTLSSKDVGVDIDYRNSFYTNGLEKLDICIDYSYNQEIYGVLLISSLEKRTGLGIWISLNTDNGDKIILQGRDLSSSIFLFIMLSEFAFLFSFVLFMLILTKLGRNRFE